MLFRYQKTNTPFGTRPNILKIKEAEQPPVSPFAIRRGDTHLVDVYERRCSISEIDFLMSKGIIGSLEIALIRFLNRLIFATSVQLTDLIVSSGVEVTQKKIQQRIKLLYEKNILNTVRFTSSTGAASYRAYTLSGNGYYILRKIGEKLHQVGFSKTAITSEIKRIRATNQLITKVNNNDPSEFYARKTLR